MSTITRLWLAQDPENGRIAAQERPWVRSEFPPGPRGDDWPQREVNVPAVEWDAILLAEV